MRFILASVAVLALVVAAVLFGWQQSEIKHLRAQVTQQSTALAESRPHRSVDNDSPLSADERQFILGQYRPVLAKLNLSPATTSRLQVLLTKRIEAALEAQDAAAREGFAPGSAGMTRAEGSAIAGVDQEIAALLGAEDDRRFVGLTSPPVQSPVVVPAPAAPVVVNVITPSPAPDYSADQPAPSAAWDGYSAPAPYSYYTPAYYYYPYATVFAGRSFGRPFVGGERFGGFRTSRPGFGGGAGPRGPVGGAPRGMRRTR